MNIEIITDTVEDSKDWDDLDVHLVESSSNESQVIDLERDSIPQSAADIEACSRFDEVKERFDYMVSLERKRLEASPDILAQLKNHIENEKVKIIHLQSAAESIGTRNLQNLKETVNILAENYPVEYKRFGCAELINTLVKQLPST